MPIRSIRRAIGLVPTRWPTCAKTALSEKVSALARVVRPEYELSELVTRKVSVRPFSSLTRRSSFFDSQTEPGETPSRSACASTNGLNDEPG